MYQYTSYLILTGKLPGFVKYWKSTQFILFLCIDDTLNIMDTELNYEVVFDSIVISWYFSSTYNQVPL